MSLGQEGEEHIPDEFEVHARTWQAQEGLAKEAAELVARFGLDPALSERMHFAAVESGNRDLTMQAAGDLLVAFNERLDEDPELGAKLRDSFSNDPETKEALARGLASLAAWAEEAEED